MLYVTSVEAHNSLPASARVRAFRVRVASLLAMLYGALMPPGLVVAALGLSASLLFPGRCGLPSRQVAFACASLVAVGSRLLLLAYLDATSIPSVNDLYASPASPFVIGFTFVGCHLGWSVLRHRLSTWPGPGSVRRR